MLPALANLVSRRPRRVLLAALGFMLVAVPLGGPVAGLLSSDPEENFTDPSAESVLAGDRLSRALGRTLSPARRRPRPPGVPVRSERGRAAVTRIAARVRRDRAVASVVSYLSAAGQRRARAARQGAAAGRQPVRLPRRPRDLPRGLPQGVGRRGGGRRAHHRSAGGRPRRHGRRLRRGRPRRRRAGLRGPRAGRAAGLPDPLRAHARRVPRRDRGAAAPVRRPADDHGDVPRPADRQRGRVDVDLRAEPGDRPGARPGHRLLPVRPVALPRGDGPLRAGARGAGADHAHAPGEPCCSAR